MTDTRLRNAPRHEGPRDGDAQKPPPGTRRKDDDKALVRKVLLEIMHLDEVDIERS